ncbi:MAG: MFS transporter [Rhodospirillaceae bacterium]|nr:MFS transporter [Rhodospirillaceae bacterium]
MSKKSARLSLIFSCFGHTYAHLFAPIFFVVALTLEGEMGLSHGEAVSLIVIGNVLYGVGAPFAGWISDKWNTTGMMSVYFIGTGSAMILTGFATTPIMLALFLGLTGLFGSIYHPVGIAWLVKNAVNRGTALGINGVFGTIGPSVAALSAGILTDTISWRAAFVVPGAIILLTGIFFILMIRRGQITETKEDISPQAPVARSDIIRTIMVLSITMLCTGLIYQATSPAVPKIFSLRLNELFSGGIMGVSVMVAMVYIVAGGFQIIAGRICDIYPLKLVYILTFIAQIPIMLLAASAGGMGLLVVVMFMVAANQASLPAENSLVARYAPAQWRGLAFGMKFILAFGISGLAVLMEGAIFDATGDFFWLFIILASIATVGFATAFLLPSEKPKAILQPAE